MTTTDPIEKPAYSDTTTDTTGDKPHAGIFSIPRRRLRDRINARARDKYWSAHDRDEYECPLCGYDGDEFEVHHIDRDWLNNTLFNLIGLCYPCHARTHRVLNETADLEAWKDGFLALGAEGDAA